MRPLTLFFGWCLSVMVLTSMPAIAVDGDSIAESPATASSAAAATVLEHHVVVTIDAVGRQRTRVTWRVRIDDPLGASAGLVAPQGLDGARDRGAQVFEETLVLPPQVVAGTEYTLSAESRDDRRGAHSGAFLTAADLPTERAQFEIQAPTAVPLHVWHDERGLRATSRRSTRMVTVTWTDVSAGQPAQVVWSTWKNWDLAHEGVLESVEGHLTGKSGLGRQLAEGYSGMRPGEAVERVFRDIAYTPDGPGDWTRARPAAEVVDAGEGSAVDRGMVLLSLLKLSGHDASPGYYRSADARGLFPLAVPAPALLGQPIVVVHRDRGDLFIDPAIDTVQVPDVPAAMVGGIVWTPGALPRELTSTRTSDGRVTVNGTLQVSPDGSATWTADVTASGTASERLRDLLRPLEEGSRVEALRRVVAAGRPDLSRFTAKVVGVDLTRRDIRLTLAGKDEALLVPVGSGLAGRVPALLAPALAAWLPPNLTVTETLAIQFPGNLQILATALPDSVYDEAALVVRRTTRQGRRLSLTTEAERPYRITTALLESNAGRFLAGRAAEGPTLVLQPMATSTSVAALREADLPEAERAVLEAMLWWQSRQRSKTIRTLRNGLLDIGSAPLADAMVRYASETPEIWQLLSDIVLDYGTAEDQLQVVRSMRAAEQNTVAWSTAAKLAGSDDIPAAIAIEALLHQEALQSEIPAAPAPDRELAELWLGPIALLERVEALGGADNPDLRERRALRALQANKPDQARAHLEAIAVTDRTAFAFALDAWALASLGGANDEVMQSVDSALELAPGDPVVLATVTDVATSLGRHQLAAHYALTVARMRVDDPESWDIASRTALLAGDLPMAGYAARKASNLTPTHRGRAEHLGLMAALLHDRVGWDTARARDAGVVPVITSFPPPLSTSMELCPPEGLLALLELHDTEVRSDPKLLAVRAQMRLDAGWVHEAARDGILLQDLYSQGDGAALAWAASAGRLFSTTLDERLDQSIDSSLLARGVRMEGDLWLGTADPAIDASAMTDDPRANVVLQMRDQPASLVEATEGWEPPGARPSLPYPDGFRINRALTRIPGVLAQTNSDEGVTILWSAGSHQSLPPGLAQLYTPGARALMAESTVTVTTLDGGPLPLYLARVAKDGLTAWVVAFSPEAVLRTALALP